MRTAPARAPFLVVAALAAGCASTPGPDAGPTTTLDAGAAADAGAPPDAGGACTPSGGTYQIQTDDEEVLEADLYSSGLVGGPAVVLLHMIPPSNDRANYPDAFISALTDRGLTVLNLDRRGAGGSTGVAREAYTGDKGKWDPKAAVEFLLDLPCAPARDRIAIVGASNGTTSAFDYAVYAAGVDAVPNPAALVFLTGGTYTEANNRIAAQRGVLASLPMLFVFSTAERAWSAALEDEAPQTWRFEELDPGDHGTRMFSERPESVGTVADFLQTTLQ